MNAIGLSPRYIIQIQYFFKRFGEKKTALFLDNKVVLNKKTLINVFLIEIVILSYSDHFSEAFFKTQLFLKHSFCTVKHWKSAML